MRRATASGRRPAWAVHLDVAGCFPSIPKETLFAILEARTSGPESVGYPVPSRLSLFGKEHERGFPIGNLTSQSWANAHLNEADRFVKRELGYRYGLRYVDNLVLVANDPGALVTARGRLPEFARKRLGFELRADGGEVRPVTRGIDFVGWKTWWSRRLPRRPTVRNLEDLLDASARAAVRPDPTDSTPGGVETGDRAP